MGNCYDKSKSGSLTGSQERLTSDPTLSEQKPRDYGAVHSHGTPQGRNGHAEYENGNDKGEKKERESRESKEARFGGILFGKAAKTIAGSGLIQDDHVSKAVEGAGTVVEEQADMDPQKATNKERLKKLGGTGIQQAGKVSGNNTAKAVTKAVGDQVKASDDTSAEKRLVMMTGEGLDVLAEANVMDKEDAKVLKKAGEFVDENKDQIAGLLEESPSATEKDGDGPKEQSFQPKVKQSHDQKVSSHKQGKDTGSEGKKKDEKPAESKQSKGARLGGKLFGKAAKTIAGSGLIKDYYVSKAVEGVGTVVEEQADMDPQKATNKERLKKLGGTGIQQAGKVSGNNTAEAVAKAVGDQVKASDDTSAEKRLVMMTGEGLDVLAEANVMDKEDAKVLKKAGEFVDENKDQIAELLEESPSAEGKGEDGPKEQSSQPKVKQSQKVLSHKQKSKETGSEGKGKDKKPAESKQSKGARLGGKLFGKAAKTIAGSGLIKDDHVSKAVEGAGTVVEEQADMDPQKATNKERLKKLGGTGIQQAGKVSGNNTAEAVTKAVGDQVKASDDTSAEKRLVMMTGEGLDVLAEANVMDKEDAKVLKKAGEFVNENKDQITELLEESPSAGGKAEED